MILKITALLAAVCLTVGGTAQGAAPLLMEGKSTLYQRVLTRPGCELKQSSDKRESGDEIPAFSRYYVYQNDGDSLLVGPDTTGKTVGYLDKDCAVDWKMQTALMLTNPAGRSRALFFATKKDLDGLVLSPDPKRLLEPILSAVNNGEAVNGVIAAEPLQYVDYKKKFYLLPILDYAETMFDDGNYTRELQVASVSASGAGSVASSPNVQNEIKAFKAAVVFVIDSSISMQPYIDRTKQAIRTIYRTIEKDRLKDSVQFGIVSFRSSTKAVPQLEYVSKVFAKPGELNSAKEFEEKLAKLNQAKVSSALFDEDAYAGVNTAINSVNWQDYGGRYIVLVTDAGAIEGENSLSSSHMDSSELRLEAAHKGIAVYSLHLLTKAGAGNHEKARKQYEDLTYSSILGKSLYYPVNAGNVDDFGNKIDLLAANITQMVSMASEGKAVAGSALNATQRSKSIEEDTALLGHAMQLAFLGSLNGAAAPNLIKGWIADRDLLDHSKITAEPVVLLTKQQLSNLKDITKNILDAANEGILDPNGMFLKLRSLAASMGRDPSALGDDKTLKLADMGILDEYLEDLPYKSRLQDLDEETWSSMGADEQNQTIADLENKLNYYQKCNDDADRWVSLAKDADPAESVYPIPLEALP